MRLWSLHPRHLDTRGLVALWREALLAQAVLRGRTRGYRHHPQLARFREHPLPLRAIARYLREIHSEAERRGYAFDRSLIVTRGAGCEPLPVSMGQLEYEWRHLRSKLKDRAPDLHRACRGVDPEPHPLFVVIPGPRAEWERSALARD